MNTTDPDNSPIHESKYIVLRETGNRLVDLTEKQIVNLYKVGGIWSTDCISDDNGQTWHSIKDVIFVNDLSVTQQEEERKYQEWRDYESQQQKQSANNIVAIVLSILLAGIGFGIIAALATID